MSQPESFEGIKKTKGSSEYWLARELGPLLGYSRWENFSHVIDKAKNSCLTSGQPVEDHFRDVTKMVDTGSRAQRAVSDIAMSRYACYLAVQNGDPTKPAVALGQSYFATKTRQQELQEQSLATLSEDERRLLLRQEMSKHNKSLSAVAKGAGVATTLDYAIFQDHGYKGLYGGMTAKDIRSRKGLVKSGKILDHMGSTELAANLFRATQTEEKLKREKIQGKDRANQTHFEVGKKVRQTIRELGGTMPENLPTPQKSIKQVEQDLKKSKPLEEPAENVLPTLPQEIGEYTAPSAKTLTIECPDCNQPDLVVGGPEAICGSCARAWDPGVLAADLSRDGISLTCPHCSQQCVVEYDHSYLCVFCAETVSASDFRCGQCNSEVPREEYEVYEESGLCGWCAHFRAKDD